MATRLPARAVKSKPAPKDDVGDVDVVAVSTGGLVDFLTSLQPQKADAATALALTQEMATTLAKMPPVRSKERYEQLGAILKDVKRRKKWLDENRKAIVKPMNDDVAEINSWFMPGVKLCDTVAATIQRMMEGWVLFQRAEERRLAEEAAAKARALLAAQQAELDTPTDVAAGPSTVETLRQEVVDAAQAVSSAVVDKVEGVSHKVGWAFTIVDVSKLDRRFLKPDEDAIKAWVAEHGDKDVPDGVEVREAVRFTTRT